MTTQLELQAAEARALLADLAAIGTELDEEEIATVIEGETDLAGAVAAAIVEAAGAVAAAEATATLMTKLAARRERQLARAERIRARITQALGSLGLRRLVTPAGSVSVVAAPPRVVVTDEEDIPGCWYTERVVRTLDKHGIHKALEQGVRIGGVELSNRPDMLRIRT